MAESTARDDVDDVDDAGQEHDEQVTRPFAAWLRDVNGGALHTELTDKLAELVTAVTDVEKKGTLTLTVSVEPMKDGGTTTLIVSDDVKLKKPEFPRKRSVFYSDDAGNLHRDDPKQPAVPGLELTRDRSEGREARRR